MYGEKTFQEFFLSLITGERGCRLEFFMREYIKRDVSAQKGSKTLCKWEAYPYLRGTVPYRTVPKFSFKRSLNAIRMVQTQENIETLNSA